MRVVIPFRMLTIGAALLFGACSQPPLPEERIREYWDAVKVADWPTTWAMEHRMQTGEDDSFSYYKRKRGRRILGYKLGQPETREGTAVVPVTIVKELAIAGGILKKKALEDRWGFADGEWWHMETVRVRPAAAKQEARQESPDADEAAEPSDQADVPGGEEGED